MTREQAAQMIEKMPISHECREFFNLVLDALRQPEIVRCKDCKYYNSLMGYCKDGHSYPSPDWFCADGKRKES